MIYNRQIPLRAPHIGTLVLINPFQHFNIPFFKKFTHAWIILKNIFVPPLSPLVYFHNVICIDDSKRSHNDKGSGDNSQSALSIRRPV